MGTPVSPNDPKRTHFNRVVKNNVNPNKKGDYVKSNKVSYARESPFQKSHQRQRRSSKSPMSTAGHQLN